MTSTSVPEREPLLSTKLTIMLRLLLAIVLFSAIAPGILMTALAVVTQLASEWHLSPGRMGYLFWLSLEL